jgi:hypothetical protein
MSDRRTVALVAALAALLAPATAAAEIRNGSAGGGVLKPANPDVRIERAAVSYDTSTGQLSGTVTTAGTLEGRNTSILFLAGTYDRKRRCETSGAGRGVLGGIVDTFAFPPDGDPSQFLPPATRFAWYGEDNLGGDGVTYSAVGSSATLTGTIGLFAERSWNCAWVDVTDMDKGTSGTDDRTVGFPLGSKAIAENQRLRRKALKRCGRKQRAAKRSACRAKARERFPGEA